MLDDDEYEFSRFPADRERPPGDVAGALNRDDSRTPVRNLCARRNLLISRGGIRK